MRDPIVIIGGGISGLATAWWLKKTGVSAVVLEQSGVVGGTMKTIRDEEWLVETGPNSALETTPLIQTLIDDVGLANEKIYANDQAARRYILRDGELRALPMSPGQLLRTSLWSTRAKLRLLKEPFVGRATREETVAEFVERRIGRELLDYGINPFVAGVYAGNPKKLSVQAAFPKLYQLEKRYGSLIKGQIKGARERKRNGEISKDRARLFSFVHGMQSLPNAIARALGDGIRTGIGVVEIRRLPDGRFVVRSEGAEWRASQVILCLPAGNTADLLRPFDGELADHLQSIHYPPVAEVFLGFRKSDVGRSLDGFGFLVPEVERRRILGCLWSTTLFPQRAPADHVALSTFVGGSRQPELCRLNDGDLTETILSDLRELLTIRNDPVYTRIVRWPKAIPQYEIGHLEKMAAIERLESRVPGLWVSGNFRGGIAVGDCIKQSEIVAQRVLQTAFQKMESVV